jgi:hypothetical protein
MIDRTAVTERDRAITAVRQCELQLRRVRDDARRAAEMVRRAARAVESAEEELGVATRRLDRMASTAPGWVQRVGGSGRHAAPEAVPGERSA